MSIISGTIGALSQKDASSKAHKVQKQAADQQADITRYMHDTARQDMEPYRNVGTNALYEAFGYTPVPGGGTAPPQGAVGVPQQYGGVTGGVQQPNGGMSPFGQLYTGNVQNYGGAGNGAEGISSNSVQSMSSPWTPYQQQMGQQGMPGIQPGQQYAKTGPGIDPTGGAGKYLSMLENFKVNEDDEVYKWRQSQTQKAVEQASAARGMYNSRPTINALADANMSLQGDEVERQQNQLKNLYGLSMGIGQTQYGKSLDAIKAGQGAASSMGQNAMLAGGNLSNIFGNLGNAAASNKLYQGQANANMFQNLSSAPINALGMYGLGGGFGKDGFSMAKLFG